MKLSFATILFSGALLISLLIYPLQKACALPAPEDEGNNSGSIRENVKGEQIYLLSVTPEQAARLTDKEKQSLLTRFINCYGLLLYGAEPQQALELMLRAQKVFPGERMIAVNLSGAYATMGDYDKSLEYALQAINEKSPQLQKGDEARLIAIAYNNAANACLNKRDLEQAKEHLKKALELQPDMGGSLYLMGELLCGQESYESSTEYFKRAFSVDPDEANPDDYFLYALALGKSNRMKEATETIMNGERKFPLTPGMHLNVASMLFNDKRYAAALYELHLELLLFKGTDRYYQNEVDQYLKDVISGATGDKNNPDYEEVSAFLKLAKGVTPGQVEEIIGKSSTKHFLLNVFLAEAYAAKGDLDKAKSIYERVILDAPYFVPAYVELGDIYTTLGDKQNADNLYEQAVRLMPDNWKVKELLKNRPDLMPNTLDLRQ